MFLYGLQAFCRNGDGHKFLEFRNVDLLFLEIWVTSGHPNRVELCCTSAV